MYTVVVYNLSATELVVLIMHNITYYDLLYYYLCVLLVYCKEFKQGPYGDWFTIDIAITTL